MEDNIPGVVTLTRHVSSRSKGYIFSGQTGQENQVKARGNSAAQSSYSSKDKIKLLPNSNKSQSFLSQAINSIKQPPTLQTPSSSSTTPNPTTMSPAKTQPWKQWYGQVKNKTELGGHYIVEVATGRSSPPTNGGTILLTKGVDLSADKPRPMSE
ncbi:hypothetical protein Vi05172_g8458 [Venturia inaequalis]|nr:hypothetical protein Vi05172_g8458 [Venturia inaequalis]